MKKCYQADSYQCGVWVYVVIKSFLQFLEEDEMEDFRIESFEDVMVLDNAANSCDDNFIRKKQEEMREQLEEACLIDELAYSAPQSTNDIELIDHTIFISKPDDCQEETQEDQTTIVQDDDLPDIFHYKFPSHITFTTASVDAQHTLWETPDASNGKEYISFLRKRHWNYYFKALHMETLYWNYDLHNIIKKSIPKQQEQAWRSSNKQATEFSTDRLLGRAKSIIGDTHITAE